MRRGADVCITNANVRHCVGEYVSKFMAALYPNHKNLLMIANSMEIQIFSIMVALNQFVCINYGSKCFVLVEAFGCMKSTRHTTHADGLIVI